MDPHVPRTLVLQAMLRALSGKATAFRPWACGLELLPLLYGSLPHSGPAADPPASTSTLTLNADGQQQQQHVSFYLWPTRLSAAAASQRSASLFPLSGSRLVTTAAPAPARATAATRSKPQDNGPSTNTGTASDGSSSSSSPQPCPLHACLLQYGITDLAAFSAPKHLALSQEAVSSNAEPKLAALAAEGLSPKQLTQLMGHKTRSPLWCSYADIFLPNLQLLRRIRVHTDYRPHPKTPHLTAAGKVAADSPDPTARYLCRNPSKVQELLQWLEGNLRIGLEQLAGCKDICNALTVSAGAVTEAAERSVGKLASRGYSQRQIQGMILKQPTLLALDMDSPLQRQKLDWIERVSPWTLEDFLDNPRYFDTRTRRLAARLALLRESGLPPMQTPRCLAVPSNANFMAAVRQQLARQGRELPWTSWAEWEEAWLGSEEGREWASLH
ncbi:hypothetical protein N2152v2_009965 [Parachlorella kessleri]